LKVPGPEGPELSGEEYIDEDVTLSTLLHPFQTFLHPYLPSFTQLKR